MRGEHLAAVVVEAHPVLGAAGLETELMGLRVEPEVVAAEFEGGQLGAEQAGNLAAVAAAGVAVVQRASAAPARR